MRCGLLWTHLVLLLFLLVDSTDLTIKSSCRSYCGNTSIPFPFGIGKGCYFNEWFEIKCNNSTSGEPVPYLPKINKEVVSIDLSVPDFYQPDVQQNPYGSLLIKTNITSSMECSNNTDASISRELLNVTGSPFTIDGTNKLVGVGCNNEATLTNLEPRLVGCIASCELRKKHNSSECNGYRCCLTNALDNLGQVVGVNIKDYSDERRGRRCRVAFLTEGSIFELLQYKYNNFSILTDPQWFHDRKYATVQLGWVIPIKNRSYLESQLGCRKERTWIDIHQNPPPCIFYNYSIGWTCLCNEGYRGNPYIPHGCKDIDECKLVASNGSPKHCRGTDSCVNTPGSFQCVTKKKKKKKKNKTLPIAIGFSVAIGVLIIIGVCFWLFKFITRRRKINRKKRFFKRNGGLLLQQQLTSSESNIEKTKVFNSKELKKATENFSLSRVLGQGGQGTVYKGMLVDGRLVAVKKSKVADEDKLEEFINEVIILSQINHRNIVKLLGCCLETEVPLLVYEFIPNGNLFEHLHDDSDDYTMATWEMRLRIATDIAGALSYLHSAAEFPIYHRDIKTANIMLDEKYRAKVADFGTSRSVTVDHTHLTTVVSGTVGYVDPEYFQSSQFSDKSDVYSFGVVLVELITGEKPISLVRFQESRTLATYFILAMKENRLVDLIDRRIRDDCKVEEVLAAAQVARKCLNLKGKKRPSMREVSMELERIRSPATGDSQPHAHIVENEVAMEINIDVESYNNVGVTAPSMIQDSDASTSYLDAEPLFPRQTW